MGFEEQVSAVLFGLRLTREQVEELSLLYYNLENALNKQWPGCKVHPFGSVMTGLGIKTSDADCFVELPIYMRIPPKKLVVIAKHILNCQPYIYQKCFAITGAKVPILKFFHTPTQRHCDLSFSSKTGVMNSRTIRFLMRRDENILSMAVILKYWSKVHGLCGTNLLPNYALIMMIIFYLQHLHILPSIKHLQESVTPVMVDNWNLNHADEILNFRKSETDLSLSSLICGFFKYYKDFNYEEHIVCPFLGYPILKSVFNELSSVPAEFSLYKSNMREGLCAPLRTDTVVCVQDMFEHHKNCAAGVHLRLFNMVKAYIDHASVICSSCNEESDNLVRDLLQIAPHGAPCVAPLRFRPHAQVHRKRARATRGARGIYKNKFGKVFRPHPQ